MLFGSSCSMVFVKTKVSLNSIWPAWDHKFENYVLI